MVVSGHYRLELLTGVGFGYVRGWTESGAFAGTGFTRFMRAIQTKTQVISRGFQGHLGTVSGLSGHFADIIPATIIAVRGAKAATLNGTFPTP
jgi:hypothetical protein